MGAQHRGTKYGPAAAVRREQLSPQSEYRTELRRGDAEGIAAFRSMAREVKLSHRAAIGLIEAAQRSATRGDVVTSWSGKVGV